MTTYEYHYTECGLVDVFILANHLKTDDHGEAVVTIPAIGILHKIIAEGVINADGILTGKEIRFLRTEYIENNILTVPAPLMKGRKRLVRDFKVPLSSEALSVIAQASRFEKNGFIFSSNIICCNK